MTMGIGTDGCCVPESEMRVVRDMNLASPHKGGNQYSRICPECGQRTFTSKRYWETAEPSYIIEKGGDEPKPIFSCPYDCGGELVGFVDECPDCGGEIEWQDDEGEDEEAEAEEDT